MRKCTDHLGNEYPSFAAMARAYGLTMSMLRARLNAYGWDLEKALTTPLMKGPKQKACRDHKGKEYPSLKEMGEAYGVPCNTVYSRMKKGWDLERILTPAAPRPKVWKDHTGKQYPTQKAMAEAYGIPNDVLSFRLTHGWDLESALTTPVGAKRENSRNKCQDHKGNIFPSKRAMAKAYGISSVTLSDRTNRGWDLERALTTPPGWKRAPEMRYKDHKGNEYPTWKAMAEAYGIPDPTFRKRLRNGYSVEEALTRPVKVYKKEKQHGC